MTPIEQVENALQDAGVNLDAISGVAAVVRRWACDGLDAEQAMADILGVLEMTAAAWRAGT